jgi:hypothetical protein
MTRATARKTAAISLDVTQSHVTPDVMLLAEHPHGLDAMTKTDTRAANTAAAPKARAMRLVVRTADRVAARRIAAW